MPASDVDASGTPRTGPTPELADGWLQETPQVIMDAADAARDPETAAEQSLMNRLLEPIQERFTCDVCQDTDASQSVFHTCEFCRISACET